MNSYQFKILAKEKNALGIFNWFITEPIIAENEDDAISKLYDTYDHIHYHKLLDESPILNQVSIQL